MTKKEKEKIINITRQWYENCQYYEKEGMHTSLKFEIGRLAANLHLCYEFGIDPGISHTNIYHFMIYQKEKENWIE